MASIYAMTCIRATGLSLRKEWENPVGVRSEFGISSMGSLRTNERSRLSGTISQVRYIARGNLAWSCLWSVRFNTTLAEKHDG